MITLSMARFNLSRQTLPVQFSFVIIAVVVLTAVASWLPEAWLIGRQLDQQAWAQVEQGRRAARALYRNWESETTNLAILTAQLPRVRLLLEQDEREALAGYISDLDANLALDLILVCDAAGEPVVYSGEEPPEAWCASFGTRYLARTAGTPEVWLLATHPIGLEGAPGVLVAGVRLDGAFVQQISEQTGVEHTIRVGERIVATSLPVGSRSGAREDGTGRYDFLLGGSPYFASQLPLAPGVTDEIALDVSPIRRTERRLRETALLSLLAVGFLASLVGVWLARRIGEPLTQLARAATRLSRGDLAAPVVVHTRVQEIRLVADALDAAREDLRHSLTDLQREKTWISHLLEAIVEGIVTLDEHGYITFWSQGAERITGLSREGVLYRPCDEVLPTAEGDAPFTADIPGPGERRKIAVRLPGDEYVLLSVTRALLTPLEATNAALALVFRDVSEEEAVHRLLGHFMANVTHEFRTPLSALAAAIELLLDRRQELSPMELEQLLTSLHLGTVGLQTLVDNLLESASLETGRFRVFPRGCDLQEIVDEAINTMSPLLEKYNQRIEVDIPASLPWVRADPRRTLQVMINLLSNAAKYGTPGTEVVVSARKRHGKVRVSVADRGPGVPEQQRDLIFHRFGHAEEVSESSRYGTGLGLWVVKAIVEAQGGDVGVEANEGGGSRFWFTLKAMVEV